MSLNNYLRSVADDDKVRLVLGTIIIAPFAPLLNRFVPLSTNLPYLQLT